MEIVLWIVAGLLAAFFALVGFGHLTQSKEAMQANPRMAWTEDFSSGTIKLIGALELLAAVGLVLPALLDTAPVLVPLAATGLVVLMLLAAATHVRRGERDAVVFNAVLAVLAALVAWGRFGPYAF